MNSRDLHVMISKGLEVPLTLLKFSHFLTISFCFPPSSLPNFPLADLKSDKQTLFFLRHEIRHGEYGTAHAIHNTLDFDPVPHSRKLSFRAAAAVADSAAVVQELLC